MSARVVAELVVELEDAELKAWQSLARYKFVMFGYWCGIWVHLNRIGGFKRPNPWITLVLLARDFLLKRTPAAGPSAALFAEEV